MVRAFYHYLDLGDVRRAGTYIDQAAAALGPFQRFGHPRVYPELAYYLARYKQNPSAARIRLNQTRKNDALPHVVLRAEAAIALAEDRFEDAQTKARQALLLVDEHSPPGIAQAEREWLASISEDAAAAIED